MTYRQALHDTLRAEMLRDDSVFLMGEEIGVFEGSYKITAGLLKEFGEKRVRDTPIAEEGFAGAAIGAAMLGLRPVVEIMTINFSMLALDQIVNHAAKIYGMFGGQAQRAAGHPHARRRRPAARRDPLAEHRAVLRLHPRHEGGRAVHPGRRQGAAARRDPRRRPGALPGEPRALQHQGRGARRRHPGRDRPGRWSPGRART